MSTSIATAAETVSNVRLDETLLLYPTAARLARDGQTWAVPLHGIVLRPAVGGLVNTALLSILRRYARIKKVQGRTENFQRRARAFLADNVRNREIFVRIGERTYSAGVSGRNGHFAATIQVPVAEVDWLRASEIFNSSNAEHGGQAEHSNNGAHDSPADPWLTCEAVLPDDFPRSVIGQTQLLAETGVSVVTDVDDTIKISNVADRRLLLLNTFVKPFMAVPGMADVFQRWAARGAAFHYISASPWQLFVPLDEFRENRGFPAGAWDMKFSNWKTAPVRKLFGSHTSYKQGKIEPLLKTFPRRRFIFVGDAGQHDPEAYGQLARAYPRQIARIFIRNLGEEDMPNKRLHHAFAGVPAEKWNVFRVAEELLDFGIETSRTVFV